MENIRFDAVGGHADDFFYGSPTPSGTKTVLKETTGWEILWYLALHFTGVDAFHSDDESTNIWFSANPCAMRFIRGVRTIKSYALVGVQFTMPSYDKVASSVIAPSLKSVLDEHLEEHGDAPVLLYNESCRPCLEKTFIALWEGMEKLNNFDDAYDKKIWALCLEDATDSLTEPCVMDLKLGFCGFSPFTAEEKKRRIQSRTSALIKRTGIRVCGTHRYIYSTESLNELAAAGDCQDEYQRGEKYKERLRKPIFYALQNEDQLACCFQHFFTSHNPLGEYCDGTAHLNSAICCSSAQKKLLGAKNGVIDEYRSLQHTDISSLSLPIARTNDALKQAEDLGSYFKNTEDGQFLINYMSFVSSSLLIIFDNASNDDTVKIYLIDFARCGLRRLNYKEEENGFLHGLEKFTILLRCLLSDFHQPDVSVLKS